MVRIHFQIPFAPQLQIHHRVPGKQGEHVIEKRDPCPDRRPALAVDVQPQGNAGLFRVPPQLRLPFLHWAQLSKPRPENKAQIPARLNSAGLHRSGHAVPTAPAHVTEFSCALRRVP
jgi:hypothetical protein